MTSNVSGDEGGGIENRGRLRIDFSTIAGNRASDDGGALRNLGGDVLIGRSTFSGNIGPGGGGGLSNSNNGNVSLSNCTFAYNATRGGGGAIQIDSGSVNLNSCTVVGNVDLSNLSASAGGIMRVGGFLDAFNSVIAQNFHGDSSRNDLSVGALNGNSVANFIGGDPLLSPLQNNGGRTLTMIPLAGSPLIDAGSNERFIDITSFLTTDQRGRRRFIDGDREGTAIVDIGAVEAPRYR